MERNSLKSMFSPGKIIVWLFFLFLFNYFMRLGLFTNKRKVDGIVQGMVLQDSINQSKFSVDDILNKLKDKGNLGCPLNIDSSTILESVTTLGKDTLIYNYLLLLDGKLYNIPLLKKMMGDKLSKEFIGTNNSDLLKKYKATVIYNYVDNKRNFLFNSIFGPSNNYNPE
jgi:hypothetical protein